MNLSSLFLVVATVILGASLMQTASCDASGAGEDSGSGDGMDRILPNATNSRYCPRHFVHNSIMPLSYLCPMLIATLRCVHVLHCCGEWLIVLIRSHKEGVSMLFN